MANRVFPYIKSAAPTVNDDTGDGYKVGDMWLDTTNDKIYQAIDVTAGAAVWRQLDAAVGGDLYNFLINGGFDFFQRINPSTATTMTDDAYNAPDRWNSLIQGSGATINRNDGIGTSKYSCKLVAGGTTNRYGIEQIIESTNSIPLRGKTVIAQVKLKPVNNAGSGTRNYRIAILEWTGTADTVTSDVVNNWASSTYTTGNFFASTSLTLVGTATVSATHNTETDLSVSGTVSASCNNLIVFVWAQDVPTHASDYVLIGEAGLYISNTVQTWKPRLFANEKNLCDRFCFPLTDATVGTASLFAFTGCRVGTNLVDIFVSYPTKMFSSPTLFTNSISYNSALSGNQYACFDNAAAGWVTATGAVTMTIANNSQFGGTLRSTAGTSFSGAAGTFCNLYWGTSPSVYLEAEL